MIRRVVFAGVAVPLALVLAGCGGSADPGSNSTQTEPSPSASVSQQSVATAPSSASSTSASPSGSASASSDPADSVQYSASDKAAFLQAIQDQTEDLWRDETEDDLVSLADSLVSVHESGASWKQVMKILTDNLPETDAEIYGELVVEHLMKDLADDDAWKVGAIKQREKRESAAAPADPEPEPSKSEPSLTAAQEQALGKAQDYLDYSHFSKKGLIEQLKYEGFSEKEATFAVESVKVSWKAQAAGKAKDYLDSSHFSRNSLIDQLKYEGFTQAQAEYGVKQAGL